MFDDSYDFPSHYCEDPFDLDQDPDVDQDLNPNDPGPLPVPRRQQRPVSKPTLTSLWILRALLNSREGRQRFTKDFQTISSIWEPLTNIEYDHYNSNVLDTLNRLRVGLTETLHRCELVQPRDTGMVADNVELMGDALSLNTVEKEILLLIIKHESETDLRALIDLFAPFSSMGLCSLISTMLNHPLNQVEEALAPRGTLQNSGLVKIHLGTTSRWNSTFELLDGLSEAMHGRHRTTGDLLSQFFTQAPASVLRMEDFAYLEMEVKMMGYRLTQAIKSRAPGVNVLLYGPPGTGKTQMARLMAEHIGVPMWEVSWQNRDGEAQTGSNRFLAYQLTQNILKSRQSGLILFDEVEDVFPSTPMFSFSGRFSSGNGKAWTNRILETNPVPAIWISNSINQIDPAYLRRFNYILEVNSPPRDTRESIVRSYFEGVPVGDDLIKQLAADSTLTPADVEMLAKGVSSCLKGVPDREKLDLNEAVRLLARERLKLYGKSLSLPAPTRELLDYNLNYLTTDFPLEDLARALEMSEDQHSTICLYGAPGTGKTAFAHYMAKRLKKPLLAKRASDLLSCWVGETEKNIAAMFREAKAQQAVLLLDEADSFLRDRAGARNQWEVSQVNEMLVQMESFDGLFICSTNLMDDMDAASMRRFTFKIRFGYLTKAQQRAMFQATLDRLNGDGRPVEGEEADGEGAPSMEDESGLEGERPLDRALLRRLDALDTLTPGDFALFVRQRRIIQKPCEPEELLRTLEQEVALKGVVGGQKRREQIGFA